jgi:hypothetical protein
MSLPLLIFVAGLVLIGLLMYLARRRTQAIKRLSHQWRFQCRGRGNHLIPSAVWQFSWMNHIGTHQIRNLIQGQAQGLDLWLFDYFCTIGGNDDSGGYHYTVVLIADESLSLPYFAVTPNSPLYKITRLFGSNDIGLSNYPEFSQHYLLRGSDEAPIRNLFNDETILFYEQRSGVHTEGFGRYLIYHLGRGLKPQAWQSLRDEAVELHQHFR